jgi:hypothetical protein
MKGRVRLGDLGLDGRTSGRWTGCRFCGLPYKFVRCIISFMIKMYLFGGLVAEITWLLYGAYLERLVQYLLCSQLIIFVSLTSSDILLPLCIIDAC